VPGQAAGEGDVLLAGLPHGDADEQPLRHARHALRVGRQQQVVLAGGEHVLGHLHTFLGREGEDHQVARTVGDLLGDRLGRPLRGQPGLQSREAAAEHLPRLLESALAGIVRRGGAEHGDAGVGPAGELATQRQGRARPRRAVGQEKETETGVHQRVHPLHPHEGRIPRAEREAARQVLRPGGLDPDLVTAEGDRRGDRPHAGERRQAEPQPLEGAHERALLHHRPAEQGAGEAVRRIAHGDVLGAEEHLHPPGAGLRLGAERELDRPQPHPLRRSLPHHQVGGAEEGGDELRLRTEIELVRRSHLQQSAEAQHRQPVGQLEGLLLVVGDEDSGDPQLALDLPDGAPQLQTHLGVEGAEGLVEQQYLGLVGQRPRDGDPLLLAAGELARHAATEA
jgi:hypothetical protein